VCEILSPCGYSKVGNTSLRLLWPRTGPHTVEQEPCSAHGRAVKKKKNKPRVEQEPRSAHDRVVNKPGAEHERRSAHGRSVNKPRAEQQPCSTHVRAINKNEPRAEQEPRPAYMTAGIRNNKLHAEPEPCSVHGCTVKKINHIQSKNRTWPMAARLKKSKCRAIIALGSLLC